MTGGILLAVGLTKGYEALRAFALGQGTEDPTPRGLAVFLRKGMAAWMGAWIRLEPSGPWDAPRSWESARERSGGPLSGEVALVLAGMALADRR